MRRAVKIAIGAGAAGAIALPAGYLTAQYISQPEVVGFAPGDGSVTNEAQPAITLDIAHADNLEDLKVALDGKDVTGNLHPVANGYAIEGVALDDGKHEVQLSGRGTGLFGGSVAGAWSFQVDTTKPKLKLVGMPAPQKWTTSARVQGQTEPNTNVEIGWPGGKVTAKADGQGRFGIDLPVQAGKMRLVVAAVDDAGNRRVRSRMFRYDDVAPVVAVRGAAGWLKADDPLITGTLSDTSTLEIDATLDGKPVEVQRTSVGFVLPTKALYEGFHTLKVTATDGAKNTTTVKKTFGVDSTNVLKPFAPLGLGARGDDVVSLTRRLRLEGLWKGPAAHRYDARVAKAVNAYEKAHDQPVTGRTNPVMVQNTEGRLVVDKGKFTVTVYHDGEKEATFPVAVGQPAYPSPTGVYHITEMYKNPTWIPPNSPWAKGLEPIPPGSGNPLGTRWIGTSAPAVGLHGTPQDWTIGTAASHGCIRMHIPDVEKLYDMVKVGWTVEFTD